MPRPDFSFEGEVPSRAVGVATEPRRGAADWDAVPRKRRKICRGCSWLLAGALTAALLVALVASLLVALQTDEVRHAAMRALGFDNQDAHAPMQTRYAGVSGFFPFAFRIDGFCLVTATGDTICMPHVGVRWSPAGLFSGEFLLSHVDVRELRVHVRAEPVRRIDELPPWDVGPFAVVIQNVVLHAVYMGDETAPRAHAILNARTGARLAVTIDAQTFGVASDAQPQLDVALRIDGTHSTQQMHADISARVSFASRNATLHASVETDWSRYLWLIINPTCPAPIKRAEQHLVDISVTFAADDDAAAPPWLPSAARGSVHIDARRTVHVMGAHVARDETWWADLNCTLAPPDPHGMGPGQGLAVSLRAAYAPANATATLLYGGGSGVLEAAVEPRHASGGQAAAQRLVVGTIDLAALPASLRAAFDYDRGHVRVNDIGVLIDNMRVLGGSMDIVIDEAAGVVGGITGDLMGTSDAFGRVLDAHVRFEHNRTHQEVRASVGTAHLGVGAFVLDTVEASIDVAAALDNLFAPPHGVVNARALRLQHAPSGTEAHSLAVLSRVGDTANAYTAEAHGELVDGTVHGTWSWGGFVSHSHSRYAIDVERSPVVLRRVHEAWVDGKASLADRVVRAEISAIARSGTRTPPTDARRLVGASLQWPLDDGVPFRCDAEFAGEMGALAALVGSTSARGIDGAFGGNMHVSGVRARSVDAWHGTVSLGNGRLGASPLGPLHELEATLHCAPGDRHWIMRTNALAGDGEMTASGRVHPDLSYNGNAPLPSLGAEIPFTLDVALRRAAGLAAARFSVNASVTLDFG